MKINTRKQAIDEKCKDCIYDNLDEGTWKFQVENCKDIKCALYQFRPLTQKTINEIKQEKYNSMSEEDKKRADRKAELARERFKR